MSKVRHLVYLDNCVWDYLYNNGIDLEKELPSDEFSISITREGEIELKPIPSPKKEFIEKEIERLNVRTDTYFGFGNANSGGDLPRCGGFGSRFISDEERRFLLANRSSVNPQSKRGSGLYHNEGDLALATRATRSIVLTLDNKGGPLGKAGRNVIRLRDQRDSGLSLGDYIKQEISKLQVGLESGILEKSSSP
jgi:hypothetical protein